MIKLHRPLSRPTILALGLGIGILAVLLPLQANWQQRFNSQDRQYGQTLASSIARETIAAAFSNDLVSLGAIARSVAMNPNILRIRIYNAENQILVQAGPAYFELPEQHLRFEKTIALQDSVAGIVEIHIKAQQAHSLPIYLYELLSLLCLLFAAYRCYRDKNFMLRVSLPSLPKMHTPHAPIAEEPVMAETLDMPTTPIKQHSSAYIALKIKNVRVLQQQLNGPTFRQTFRLFEQQLNAIGALYGAVNWRWLSDRYLIELHASEDDDTLFNAACCAKLLVDLCGIIERVPLDLSAQISCDEAPLEIASMPFVGLAVHDIDAALLAERVTLLEYGDDTANCQLIADFNEPYAELLQKQMLNLKQQPAQIKQA